MVNGSRNAPTGSAGFLAGLRVLELSGGLAGSFCGRLFADAGADVIKIEPPGGDPSRMHGPFAGNVPHHETSLRFLAVNAGKRSLVLDPESERDQERLGALTAYADVLIEEPSPNKRHDWRLSAGAIESHYPALVHAHISPYGREGPYRDYVADELTIYALSGLMYHIGSYDREPLRHGADQAPYLAGINAAAGVLLALLNRDRDGAGQRVDVSMQECLRPDCSATWVPR